MKGHGHSSLIDSDFLLEVRIFHRLGWFYRISSGVGMNEKADWPQEKQYVVGWESRSSVPGGRSQRYSLFEWLLFSSLILLKIPVVHK